MRAVLPLIALVALAGCGTGSEAGNQAQVANVTAPAGVNWVEKITRTPEGGYIQGNPDAPIKLVEYGSRSCPACQGFAMTAVEPLRAEYVSTGRVSYEFREYFVHPQDLGLALLGRCVAPEAYFPVLDQMYAEQQAINAQAEAVYRTIPQNAAPLDAARAWAEGLGAIDFMKQRGLPEDKARQCLASKAELDVISKMIEGGVAKGVNGTPSLFINDKPVGGIAWPQVEEALKAAGAR